MAKYSPRWFSIGVPGGDPPGRAGCGGMDVLHLLRLVEDRHMERDGSEDVGVPLEDAVAGQYDVGPREVGSPPLPGVGDDPEGGVKSGDLTLPVEEERGGNHDQMGEPLRRGAGHGG